MNQEEKTDIDSTEEKKEISEKNEEIATISDIPSMA